MKALTYWNKQDPWAELAAWWVLYSLGIIKFIPPKSIGLFWP